MEAFLKRFFVSPSKKFEANYVDIGNLSYFSVSKYEIQYAEN